MFICGVLLIGFMATVIAEVVLRNLSHPWQEAQEWSVGFFIWGSFLGAAVAVRRDEHFRLAAIASSLKGWWRTSLEVMNRLVILAVALVMVYFGYLNYLSGFYSYLMPSVTPMAILFAAIPASGALICLFMIEELAIGVRRGFGPETIPTTLPQSELNVATKSSGSSSSD
jgi:TRAP-type C4-dicarboxylate transport system permease small subunit